MRSAAGWTRFYPVIRRAADLQDDLDDAFRAVGECDEDDRAEGQLDRVLGFKACTQPVVFEQVPDPHQENQPDADGGENIIHRLDSINGDS